MFALRFDGFIQSGIYTSLDSALEACRACVKSSLYQYDLAVVEIDSNRKTIRTIYP